jgi:hypothetical protein
MGTLFTTSEGYQKELRLQFTRTKSAPVKGSVKRGGREEKLVRHNREKYFSGAPPGVFKRILPETRPSTPTTTDERQTFMSVFRNPDIFTSLALAVAAVCIASDEPHALYLLFLCRETAGMQQVVLQAMQATLRAVLRSDNQGVMALNREGGADAVLERFVRLYGRFRVVRQAGSVILNTARILNTVHFFPARCVRNVPLLLPRGFDPLDMRRGIQEATDSQRWEDTVQLHFLLDHAVRDSDRLDALIRKGVFSREENRRAAILVILEARRHYDEDPHGEGEDNHVFFWRTTELIMQMLQSSFWVADITPSFAGYDANLDTYSFPNVYGIQMTVTPWDAARYAALLPNAPRE